jgi:hypothetical protein
MKRLISHGQAIRSILGRSLVIHFMMIVGLNPFKDTKWKRCENACNAHNMSDNDIEQFRDRLIVFAD